MDATVASQQQPVVVSRLQNDTLRETLISLNNSAVTLLGEYNNYRASIQTIKDALELLKPPRTTVPHDVSLVQSALTNAMNRMATCAEELNRNNVSRVEDDDEEEDSNENTNLGVVIFSCLHDADDVYHQLATLRTSKVALIIDDVHDRRFDLHVVQSVMVYNYGIAHRCCGLPEQTVPGTGGKIGTFCLQIFQYAEKLILPALQSSSPSASSSSFHNTPNDASPPHLLLYRLVLTRNLMMLSCKLGLSLCELYKDTLDPIVSEILEPTMTQRLNQQHETNGASAA
jgi:hypothetical protein